MDSADNVKKPSHYTAFKMQPIEFFRANRGILDFMQMCVIKYVCRYPLKNGREDLLKARNYIDMMIEDWDKEHSTFVGAKHPCYSSNTARPCNSLLNQHK